MYQHTNIENQNIPLPLGKVVCVGRNYAEHAKELGNEVPDAPILFIKPATAVVSLEHGFAIPQHKGNVHHEAEIALLISQDASQILAENAWSHVSHVSVALDLTLRDVQSKLKEKSHPWEIAKAFDGACPLGKWVHKDAISDLNNIAIELYKNGEQKQKGDSTQMITPIPELIAYMSNIFTLKAGDVILTGTPAGVGPLENGDGLLAKLDGQYEFPSKVI
ncbi:fumarylacetoacetate hydrolase family protein [Oceaniserpentilla sp. 4NH20-0058]|uniref:fumarylacetoacetate hydrolase family protein n=1 Tax=Oceaniserpentilla sp. 4NH20-0058 TaxID=3127660 RepID=UPI003108914F